MDNALKELYQEVILDHSRHPRHYGVLEGASHKAEGYNPLCGDRVTVYLILGEDDRVADIRFQGRARADAEKLMEGFLHLVKGEEVHGLSEDDRETLDVMSGISAFPMRVKCATLAWHTFRNAVEEGKNAVEEGAA